MGEKAPGTRAPARALAAAALFGGLAGAGTVVFLRRSRARSVRDTMEVADPDSDTAEVWTPSDKDTRVSPDDLDQEHISQLHAATLKASESCFELKKLCATVLIPTGALVALFTDRRLDAAVFIAGLLVVTAFWLADAVGYFYQRRLRVAMTAVWLRRAERCEGGYRHVPRPNPVSPLRAAFNASMLYYLILASVLVLGFLFFRFGVIGLGVGGVE